MAAQPKPDDKKQAAAFRRAARELGCDNSEERFKEALRTVVNAKPSPEIFELAIRRLGLRAADSLVVEDAIAGIQAAKAAGAVACGIPSTCCADDLVRAGADLIIDELEDLLEIGAPA